MNHVQNEYILYYLQSDIILYLFKTKNIFTVCLSTSMLICSLFCIIHFYFSMPLPVIDSIVYYIDGNIYLCRI